MKFLKVLYEEKTKVNNDSYKDIYIYTIKTFLKFNSVSEIFIY